MPSRKVIATVIGIAGSIAVAWGLHGLMLIGNCGGYRYPECPPESTPYFIAMAVGMPAAIIAGIIGARTIAFGLFPAVAIGAFWAGFDMPAGERGVAFLIGGIFAAVMLVPFAFVPLAALKRRRAARLLAEGAQAIGTVTHIRDTGVTINNNPRVELTFRVEPLDGSADFEAKKTVTVSRVKLPHVGDCHPIWYDRADPTSFMFATDVTPEAPPEVRRLFALAAQRNADRVVDVVGVPDGDPLDRLAKLNQLRLSGALTETEFEAQKARILGTA